MVQGAADFCDEPQSSQGLGRFFTGSYTRLLLNGIGHFPHREAPEEVAEAVLGHLQDHDPRSGDSRAPGNRDHACCGDRDDVRSAVAEDSEFSESSLTLRA
jgi:hypothetical protein